MRAAVPTSPRGNSKFLARHYLKEKEINPDEANNAMGGRSQPAQNRSTDADTWHRGGTRLQSLAPNATSRRRIDNQLRGRSDAGDPGSSRFSCRLKTILCDIRRRSASQGLMLRLGMEEGVAYRIADCVGSESKGTESVEGHNFSSATPPRIRRCNEQQRETIYGLRRDLLIGFEGETPGCKAPIQPDYVLGHHRRRATFHGLIDQYMPREQRPMMGILGLKESCD